MRSADEKKSKVKKTGRENYITEAQRRLDRAERAEKARVILEGWRHVPRQGQS